MTIATVNPTTGETLKTFEPYDETEVDRRLALADRAFRSFRKMGLDERARLVRSLADLLDEDKASLAETMTTEMGKPVVQARAEMTKCADGLRFYAENAPAMLADEPVTTTAAKHGSYVKYQPIGPVLAVMPWNFPLWQVIRFAAPAFMAGNVTLLKHASNVPQTALYLEDAARRAGFADGVFQTLLVGSDRVQQILEDDRVKAATLTGSEAAGRSVAAIAGRAIKKTVLELGGADPFIVMPSADLERAVEVGLWARIQNNGQSCIAAKRFILHDAIADEYEERYGEAMSKLVVGDPLDEATQIGPLATAQGRDEVNEQIADALSKGAKPLCGGGTVGRPGLVRPAHGAVGHNAGHARLSRRGLRAGHRVLPGRRHRRGDSARQRHGLRARLERLDRGPGRAAALRRRDRGGHGLHQLVHGLVLRPALRWDQALGVRTGADTPRHPRVHQRQDRLGRLTAERRGPVDGAGRSVVVQPPACGADDLQTRQRPDEALHGVECLDDDALGGRRRGDLDERALMQVLVVRLGDRDREP